MDAASEKPPAELSTMVDAVERDIVALRDVLIERVRHGTRAARDAPDAASLLEQLNIALSLVIGLEYPAAAVERELLGQARGLLQDVLNRGFR